jgi:hypothetical protein
MSFDTVLTPMAAPAIRLDVPSIPVYLRLPPELAQQVDEFADRMKKEVAGLKLSRPDAIRMLLERALAAEHEKPAGVEKPRRARRKDT